MRRFFWLALPLVLSASPAYACMASGGPDGLTYGLIWENPQTEIPKSATRMRIAYKAGIAGSSGFLAEVLNGPSEMEGKTYRFMAESGNSCTGLGARKGYIVVRKKSELVPVGINGKAKAFLMAIEFEESWLNFFLRIFSENEWRYAGSQGPGSLYPF